MKKLLVVLAVAMMALPAMAAVGVTAAVDGQTVTLSYTADNGEALRGVALDITLEGGTIAALSDVTVPTDVEFNAFIDYYASNENFLDNLDSDLPGTDAHPVCDVNARGVQTVFPTNTFGICMGYLDEDGNETKGEAAPGTSKTLVAFTVTCDESAESVIVKVAQNSLRGGIVGDSVDVINVPMSGTDVLEVATVTCGEPCLSYAHFADGDTNGDNAITASDIQVVLNYWGQTNVEGPATCADLNGDGAVTATDIQIILNNWGTVFAD